MVAHTLGFGPLYGLVWFRTRRTAPMKAEHWPCHEHWAHVYEARDGKSDACSVPWPSGNYQRIRALCGQRLPGLRTRSLRRITNRPRSWGNFPTEPPNPPRGGCRSASLLPLSSHLLPPFAPGYGQLSGSRTRGLWRTPLWGKLDLRHRFSRHRHWQRNPVTTVTNSLDSGRYFPFKARRSGPYLSPRSLDHFSRTAAHRCIKATGRALGPGCNQPSSLAARLVLAGHAFWPGCRAT